MNKQIKITERDFSSQVEDLLDLFGWLWCHWRPARTAHGWRTALSGKKGYPDYTAVKGNRLLVFELKSEKGKVSPEQQEWIDALQGCGGNVECYIFRPSDIDRIAELLRK